MSKISFIILIFVLVIRLLEQLIIKPFSDNFIFWSSLFSEIGPYFCWLVIKWTQVQLQKYLVGSNSRAKISIWLAVHLCAAKVRSCYPTYLSLSSFVKGEKKEKKNWIYCYHVQTFFLKVNWFWLWGFILSLYMRIGWWFCRILIMGIFNTQSLSLLLHWKQGQD